MPIYTYECEECGEFDIKQSIHDENLEECPDCDSKVKKLITKVNFNIKGASSKNGYFMPPSNRDLGLETESQLLKKSEDDFYMESLNLGRDLTAQEREVMKEKKKQENEVKRERDGKIKKFKEKYPELHDKTMKAFKKSKNVSAKERTRRAAERRKKGLLGVKKSSEVIKGSVE